MTRTIYKDVTVNFKTASGDYQVLAIAPKPDQKGFSVLVKDSGGSVRDFWSDNLWEVV